MAIKANVTKQMGSAMIVNKTSPSTCDIFCNVIDNYGDIGVCWRLARQLANEYGMSVRLWVDDMASLAKLCPETNVDKAKQKLRGVEVCSWCKEFPKTRPADLVIEAFACKLPPIYIEEMADQPEQHTWVNLEYLSAEDWIESHHKLPSPHPKFPLTKYFFFPGFTNKTGGLLLEHDLFARRDSFLSDTAQQKTFWKSMRLEMPKAETLKISLFAYENDAVNGLFETWSTGARSVLCLMPEGRILPQVGKYFADDMPCVGKHYSRGNLDVHVVPFVEQERYDELLWTCDVNFVRGEDSFVRAQWAGKPFVWQIYPQHDAVHLKKLQSFLMLFNKPLENSAGQAVEGLWNYWNSGGDVEQAWPAFAAELIEVNRRAQEWSQQLSGNNLALNLLDFYEETGRMRALKNEG